MSVYSGQCHCGSVKFELTSDEAITTAAKCNCSLCRRKGYPMLLVPKEQFSLLEGESSLSDYQWNTKAAHHYFCRNCGVYTHHKPRTAPDMIGVNAGCFDEIEPNDLKIDMRNGAGLSLEN